MESVMTTSERDNLVSSFLEIAVGQTVDTATQFLQVIWVLLSLPLCNFCFLLRLQFLSSMNVKVVFRVPSLLRALYIVYG